MNGTDLSAEDVISERSARQAAKKLADDEAYNKNESKQQQAFKAKLSEAIVAVDDEAVNALDRLRYRGWLGGELKSVVTKYVTVTDHKWWFKKYKHTEQHTEQLAVWPLSPLDDGNALYLASNGKIYQYGPSRYIDDDNHQPRGYHVIHPPQADVFSLYWPTSSDSLLERRASALVDALRKVSAK